MAEFQYKARDANGGSRSGIVQANSRSLAASQLRGRGLIVLALEAVNQLETQQPLIDWSKWLKPRPIDVEISLQQLSMMLRSGTTLLNAMMALVEQAPRKSLANVWEQVANNIQAGDNLSTAMSRHRCFPEFVIQMLKVGERTGDLSPVLNRSVATMKSRRRGIQAISSALIYPILVVLVAIGVTVYMIVYLIPRLEVYLQALGKDMPAMTQRMVDVSIWLREYYAVMMIISAALLVFAIVAYTSQEGRMWIDRLCLRIPVLGKLIRLCETSTFARSLSIMLGSGITLIDGLGTVQNLTYNRFLAQTVSHARDKIIQGSNFSDAIDETTSFSPILKKMVAVGQQSGDLQGVLSEVADYQDDQFGALIRRLNALVAPALTVGVGGVVGYVYIAFFVALLAAGS